MRSLIILILGISLFAACNGSDSKSANSGTPLPVKDSASLTTIEWKAKQIDYGKIPEGQKLDISYDFTNAGDKPLVISKVEPSCGCTVAETPTAPIAPGKQGSIKASFDSNGRPGVQHKTIYVYTNAKGASPQELVFTVEVIKKG